MRRLLWAAACVAMTVVHLRAGEAQPVRYDGHKLVRVTLDAREDVARMLDISGDYWSETIGVGTWPFRVAPQDMPRLKASNLPFEVLQDDIQALIDASRPGQATAGFSWFDDYKSYDQVNSYLDTLAALRPGLATKVNIGQSLEGRAIYGLRIAGPATTASVLYSGCQHAREWVAVMVPMYIADRLVRDYDTDPAIHALVDTLAFYIVPIANPDGYVYTWSPTGDRLWRKNRRNNGGGSFGVDLNRNWSVGWGGLDGSSDNPDDLTYHGTAPFSEPETQVLRDFVVAHPDMAAHIDFHSFSQLVLSPYGYFTGQPGAPDGTLYEDLNNDIAEAILNTHGVPYVAGPAASTLYIASGIFPDWSYAQGAFSWTIELRDTGQTGFLLPADQIVPTSEEAFQAAMVVAGLASQPLVFVLVGSLPAVVEPDMPAPVSVYLVEVGGTLQAGGASLHYRTTPSGSFTAVPLASSGNDLFTGTLPGALCGSTIQYYFEAQAVDGRTVTAPPGAPAAVYSAEVTATFEILADDMEQNTGWTAGAPGDTATTGLWTRLDPIGTTAQPENDHSGFGTMCWVTGQGTPGGGAGENDVDNGKTTLLSPIIDLANEDAVISYWRWYSNDQGGAPNNDVFIVDISNNGGASWINAETIGPGGPETAGGWVYHELTVSDYVQPTQQVRLRFVAADDPPGSVIEAAIDDFAATRSGCSALAPTALAAGSRYLELTAPQLPPGQTVALLITSDDFPCLSQYVTAQGQLADDPVFQPAASWNAQLVSGPAIIPSTTYKVWADTGSPGSPQLSPATQVTTWMWGDVNNSQYVDLLDILCILDGFGGHYPICALAADDLASCQPDGAIDLLDVVAVLDAFAGAPVPCGPPCP